MPDKLATLSGVAQLYNDLQGKINDIDTLLESVMEERELPFSTGPSMNIVDTGIYKITGSDTIIQLPPDGGRHTGVLIVFNPNQDSAKQGIILLFKSNDSPYDLYYRSWISNGIIEAWKKISTLELDDTLSSSTKAATAKATGDAISNLNTNIQTELDLMMQKIYNAYAVKEVSTINHHISISDGAGDIPVKDFTVTVNPSLDEYVYPAGYGPNILSSLPFPSSAWRTTIGNMIADASTNGYIKLDGNPGSSGMIADFQNIWESNNFTVNAGTYKTEKGLGLVFRRGPSSTYTVNGNFTLDNDYQLLGFTINYSNQNYSSYKIPLNLFSFPIPYQYISDPDIYFWDENILELVKTDILTIISYLDSSFTLPEEYYLENIESVDNDFYAGTVDFTTGKSVNTYKHYTIGQSLIGLFKLSTSGTRCFRASILHLGWAYCRRNRYCNALNEKSLTQQTTFGYFYIDNNYLYIYDSDSVFSNLSQFLSWLLTLVNNGTPLEFWYEVYPLNYIRNDIDLIEIKTKQGNNYFSIPQVNTSGTLQYRTTLVVS